MIKRADSLRGQGKTSMAIDIPTRAKLHAAAARAGMPLAEYIRLLADRETIGHTGHLIPTENTIESVKRDTTQAVGLLRALSLVLLKGIRMTPEEVAEVQNSPLGCFSDKEIIDTYKHLTEFVKSAAVPVKAKGQGKFEIEN